MDPVRIKLYGLVSMTRRRYVAQLAAFLGLAVVGLVGWWLFWPQARTRMAAEPDAAVLRAMSAGMEWFPWVVLGLVAVQLVEAYFVLRRFRAKEAT